MSTYRAVIQCPVIMHAAGAIYFIRGGKSKMTLYQSINNKGIYRPLMTEEGICRILTNEELNKIYLYRPLLKSHII